jgi:DNA-directed RNA polymerase specialized sigma24 family protein
MVKKPDDPIRDKEIPELIEGYRHGDQEGFVILAGACSKPVWLYIRAKASEDVAEDLFQEYQIALALYLRGGKHGVTTLNHLQRLAFTIGKRVVASFYRDGEQEKKHRSRTDVPDVAEPNDPHGKLERSNLLTRLLLDTNLTDAQRDAVVFVYLMDQTKKKAAADLGISEKSLRERLDGAFKKFRDYLDKERTP